MERSDGMILGVGFALAGVLGLPLALLLGYTLLMAASGVFVVVALGVVVYMGIRALGRIPVRQTAYKVLGLFGFRKSSDMGELLQSRLEGILRLAPATSCPAACGCVRRCGDAYVGVVRIGTQEGHRYEEVHAASKDEAIADTISRLESMMARFPVVAGTKPAETDICYEAVCPLGGPLKSFAANTVAA